MVQFWRKTEIVNDTGVFQSYPDLFIGQQDTMDVKGGTASRRAIMEFKVADNPTFGDAVITAVRPNFYINSLDLNDSTELPRYKGYVFNNHLSDLSSAEGDLALKDESAVIIESIMSGDGSWLEENFDGAPRQIAGDVPELEVENGTVTRTIAKAIKVEDLVDWLLDPSVTGGDGNGSGGIGGWLSAVLDEAEYSDDFDEYINNGRAALTQWLCTNYGFQADNIQGMGTTYRGAFSALTEGAIAGMGAGVTAGFYGSAGNPAVMGSMAVTGAVIGAGSTNHDAWVSNGKRFSETGDGYIIPLKHEKRRARKDYYRPKKTNNGPNWWIHSKDIDKAGLLLKDLKITKSVESDIDVNSRIHPGNSIFDMVRRQKSYWIADPEDYNNEIEAAYTRAVFTSAGGFNGQAAELKCHWRHIDSAEVADSAKMIPVAQKDGFGINNRQELALSYGHIPRPNEKEVYHAGAYDVDAQSITKNDEPTTPAWEGYASSDDGSRDTFYYEKMLDNKVATKVSFTVNLKDLENAWVEPVTSSGASVFPLDTLDGLISSRRGFFCTLSRNPVKQGKAGENAQTFTDYLIDNRAAVTDANTGHTNIPGTFVLGFLHFPTDTAITKLKDTDNDGGVDGNTGYIHEQRQNKISVVWHDYWNTEFAAAGSKYNSIGWQIDNNFNRLYQGLEGIGAEGNYDIRWMGLANADEDQQTDRMVLLDPDTTYTVDMFLHPKVPCIRVHITDAGTGKRVDENKIMMWAGPYAVNSLKTIVAGANTSSGVLVNHPSGGSNTYSAGTTGAVATDTVKAWDLFQPGTTVYKSDGTVVGTVKERGNYWIKFDGGTLVTLTNNDELYYSSGNHANSRMGDESRWPSYCTFWLNNTHWQTSNDSASAAAGYDVSGAAWDGSQYTGITGKGAADKVNQIDIFTGGAAMDGIHCESTVLLDEFKIFNVNTTKQFATVSKNCIKSAMGRLPISSYSEVEGLYRPMKHYKGNWAYEQEPDSDAAPYTDTSITNLSLASGGKGFTTNDPDDISIVFSGAMGSGAKAKVTEMVDDGTGGTTTYKINQIELTAGGTGYQWPPTVSFVGGGRPSGSEYQPFAYASIGTSALPREVVKKISAPRYISIGFDSIPSDMYTLYGTCSTGSGDTASTTTKVFGGTDSGGNSTLSAGVTTSKVYTINGAAMGSALSQTNPQTTFTSITDNELIGGKLKIHYSQASNRGRAGDAGTNSAVRDIVAASNASSNPYVEVWPPLPNAPTDADFWEIQSRSHMLFSDLITQQIHDVTQLTSPDFDYARMPANANDASGASLGETEVQKITRGVFNLGWDTDCADISGLPAYTAAPEDSQTAVTVNGDGDSTIGTAPKGVIMAPYWDDSNSSGVRQGLRAAVAPNDAIDGFRAPNGSTKAVAVWKQHIDTTSHDGPLGLTRTFDSPVDLTDCDIMYTVRVPLSSEEPGTIMQIDAEGSDNEQLNHLYAKPSATENAATKLAQGPQYAVTLRCYDAADTELNTTCLHKDNFMVKSEVEVYKNIETKTPANGYWIKLVFPTAGLTGMDAVSKLEFALNINQTSSTRGADWSGSGAGNGGAVVHIAGIQAIPRGTADVMAGFSNSQNATGELSKETFLSVQDTTHARAKDGMRTTEVGMFSGATKANPKVAGLTVGGNSKLNTGYLTNGTLADGATSLEIDDMGTSAIQAAINVDDRISIGTGVLGATWNGELMRVKTIDADLNTLTLERGVDGTTASTDTYADNEPIFVHTPSDAEVVIRDYDYDVEGFSQKGFVNFGFSENAGVRYEDSITWQKRENPLAATRVLEVVGYSEQGVKIRIDQPDIFQCENDTNKEWILYQESPRETQNVEESSTTFTFNSKMLSGDILTLPKTDYLSDLPDDTSTGAPIKNFFISPYKYWLYLRICPKVKGNKGTTVGERNVAPDVISFPKRSYKSIVRTENYFKGVSGTHNTANTSATHYSLTKKDAGPTWNESVFTDGKYLNPWSMNFGEIRPVFEQGKDYGFGPSSTENPEGGQVFENDVSVGWKEEILPSVVRLNNIEAGDKVSFMITPQESSQNYEFSINSQENSSNNPYLLTTFFDALPVISDFSVKPNEENPMFPTFTWNPQGSDLWYGFLKIGTDAIYHQYHNSEVHIPMNESTTATLTVNDSTTNVSSSNITMTREGLAGYAVDFNGGTNSYLQYGASPATSDATPNCTTNMSVIAHIVPDSATDTRYIISQNIFSGGSYSTEKFYLRLNASNQVEAKVSYSASGAVTLTSGAIVPTDGYTPSVIILTVDTTAREGNVKLYVNGKLEDQTGLVDATGTSDNWKTDATIHTGNSNIRVGGHQLYDTASFDGRIEEVVIYKDLIYPIDVKKGEYTLTKPLKEVNSSGKRQSYNSVLFIKDYHNIRGKRPEDVARTEPLTFSKSAPAVTGG